MFIYAYIYIAYIHRAYHRGGWYLPQLLQGHQISGLTLHSDPNLYLQLYMSIREQDGICKNKQFQCTCTYTNGTQSIISLQEYTLATLKLNTNWSSLCCKDEPSGCNPWSSFTGSTKVRAVRSPSCHRPTSVCHKKRLHVFVPQSCARGASAFRKRPMRTALESPTHDSQSLAPACVWHFCSASQDRQTLMLQLTALHLWSITITNTHNYTNLKIWHKCDLSREKKKKKKNQTNLMSTGYENISTEM